MQKQVFTTLIAFVSSLLIASGALGAPYAAMVMDARTGKVLHSRNAETKLHPASLTKMMTLYLAFQAVESGKLKLDQKVKVSRNAASEPPSRLGLKAGSRISIRHLIRATAVKSANDAATALGEAIAGSESAFTKQMTRQARALGMKDTTFKNAHGLTQSGHLSTARDMTILGLRLMYDFPEYYHLFSRRSVYAGLATVPNTNRRLLANYRGADGIKTGYTNAAGFNLVSSAQRGNKRVIATVFGGRSSASRNARVAELLDMGFARVPKRYSGAVLPAAPKLGVNVADVVSLGTGGMPNRAIRPKHRPSEIIEQLTVAQVAQQVLEREIISAAQSASNGQTYIAAAENVQSDTLLNEQTIISSVVQTDTDYTDLATQPRMVVDRADVPYHGDWVVQLGDYDSRFTAEKVLLRTALTDLQTFDGATHSISPTTVDGRRMYRVEFSGLSANAAKQACARLQARNTECISLRPRG